MSSASAQPIPGYAYGDPALERSPISLDDLRKIEASLLFGEEDARRLREAADILRDQVEAILDVWYGFVGSQPHLLDAFRGSDGQPVGPYLEAVRKRFGQWILDTCEKTHDQTWLDWQQEIGLRHHRAKKNRTDSAAAADIVPLSHLLALVYPITATIRPFLEKKSHSADEVEGMHQAWFKAVLLQAILWSRPYVAASDF